jgi:hypothetical protein
VDDVDEVDDIAEIGWPNSDDGPNGVIDIYDLYARPFNGAGEPGEDQVVGSANGEDADVNYVYIYARTRRKPEYRWDTTSNRWVRGSGADEDYDYPDHNNMAIGAVRADGRVLVPSFHRPGYIQATPSDWTFAGSTSGRGSRLILRPRGVEHPSFRGNPNHTGPNLPTPGVTPGPNDYDVDNMGLGRTDSIWVDLGYPVQRTLDGRKFKPLFAFLVVDLDGKVNLNVAGNLNLGTEHSDFALAGGRSIVLGSGYTPTETNLYNLLGDKFFPSCANAQEYARVLEGGLVGPGGSAVVGRWGEPSLVGTSTPPRPGGTGTDDEITYSVQANFYTGFPGTTFEGRPFTKGGYYRTPPGFDGDGAMYLELSTDGWGTRTRFDAPGTNGWGNASEWTAADFPFVKTEPNTENLDEPSELNFYSTQSTDSPYGPDVIELLHRTEDVDGSSLLQWVGSNPSARLALLAPSLFDLNNVINRRRRIMLTTESWDLARFNMAPLVYRESTATTATSWTTGKYNGQFPDLFKSPPLLTQRYGANTVEGLAIPDAIRRGRRLNLAPQLDSIAAKNRLARDLYVLLVQVCGSEVPADRLAQFAINVVDFSDTEVGNTDKDAEEAFEPFEFDNNLSDGFFVDGKQEDATADLQPGNSDVVWGIEEPRVIISETLAYVDSASGQAKLWIELYNMSDKNVELFGANKNYELILDDRSNAPTFEGEPSDLSLSLKFDTPAATTLAPGDYLVIGPEATPTKLGPAVTPGYIPAAPLVPAGSGQYRLYLRRLANTNQAEDTANRANFPRSLNPYITIDALDVDVHSDTTFDDPDPTVYGTVVSLERESLSVRYVAHAAAAAANDPTHTMSTRNTAATAPLPRLPFLDRPLASPIELMLVPAVGAQHLTTAFSFGTRDANTYTGKQGGSEDLTDLETGTPRTAPFKNSDGDYLYGYLLNFFREDTSGTPPAPSGKAKGKGKGKAKGRTKRAASTAPTPGYYRIMEFVEVPSRMNGYRDAALREPRNQSDGRNRLDRIAGKVNINTMWEQETLQAACNNHPASLDAAASSWFVGTVPTLNPDGSGVPSVSAGGSTSQTLYTLGTGGTHQEREQGNVTAELWRKILQSVANPTQAPDPTLQAGDGLLFTPDDRPFRSLSMGYPVSSGGPGPTIAKQTSIHDTLLRGLMPVSGTTTRPVFSDDRGMGTGDPANPPPGLAGPPNDLSEHPQYQWQLYQKMSNVFTTRSNVYAVWVTVGFFEVLNEDPSRLSGLTNAPPELGKEINADIGKNIRHRAFFVIDRSRARGYAGPPRSSAELQDVLGQVVIHSRIIE